VNGDIRITEQGETITQKYANLVNAAYNMELLTAGATARTLLDGLKGNTKHSNETLFEQNGKTKCRNL
jgi:phosphoenolpyruvate carboxylase